MPHCVACREFTREGAQLCPRCGTAQTTSRWKTLGRAVKWAGAAVTVISLSMGVITLSGVYERWRDERDAVSELVAAARWLSETEHYPQAWQMLSDALELSPTAPDVRRAQVDLALVWLRDFSVQDKTAGETLDRLTAVLFRRLARAKDDQVATILAHVAWAQIQRARFHEPVLVDIDALFERALAANPRDGYANAFAGYWHLAGRGIGPDDVQEAQEHFHKALDSVEVRDLARRLQLRQLANLSYGHDDELERAALAALLVTCREMMELAETPPVRDVRYRILDGYGVMGRAEHVESLVDVLPPDDHLAVTAWLRAGLDYDGRPRLRTQLSYLEARLIEAKGEPTDALRRYRELLGAEHSTGPLDTLVDTAIQRLTGKLPERALARKYISDPVDPNDPWSFHVDTLLHFDPIYQPPNLDQALEFLTGAVATKDPRIPGLLPTLELAEDRVRGVVAAGDERARLDAYTMNYSAGHHEMARANLIRLAVLRGQSLVATDALDAAVATLSDAAKVTDALGEGEPSLRALASYELAGAYARRAEATDGEEDRARALERLRLAVEAGVIEREIASWDDIKSEPFRALAGEAGYRDLIRGR